MRKMSSTASRSPIFQLCDPSAISKAAQGFVAAAAVPAKSSSPIQRCYIGGEQPLQSALSSPLPLNILETVKNEAAEIYCCLFDGVGNGEEAGGDVNRHILLETDQIHAQVGLYLDSKAENNEGTTREEYLAASKLPPVLCYEVLRVKNGKFVSLADHNERFLKSMGLVLVENTSKAVVGTLAESVEPAAAGGGAAGLDGFSGLVESLSTVRDAHSELLRELSMGQEATRLSSDPDVLCLQESEDGTCQRWSFEHNVKIIAWVEKCGEAEESMSPQVKAVAQEEATTAQVRAQVNAMLRRSPAASPGASSASSSSFSSSRIRSIAYYIKSSYPPEEWYQPPPTTGASATPVADGKEHASEQRSLFQMTRGREGSLVGGGPGGCDLALLYNGVRHSPNAKAVHASLRQRSSDIQKEEHVHEAILVHPDGTMPEGSRSNIFLITANDELLMSRDETILVGCTRLAVNRIAEQVLHKKVLQRDVSLVDLFQAKAVVMTGTSPGVLPVRRVFLCPERASKAHLQGIESEPGNSERLLARCMAEAGVAAFLQHTVEGADVVGGGRPYIHYESAAHPIVQELIRLYNTSVY